MGAGGPKLPDQGTTAFNPATQKERITADNPVKTGDKPRIKPP